MKFYSDFYKVLGLNLCLDWKMNLDR